MKLKSLKCYKCNSTEFKGMSQGDHMGIYCRNCDGWIKWASKSERALLTETPGGELATSFKLDIIVDGLERIEEKLNQILGGKP